MEAGFRDFKVFMRGSEVYKGYVANLKRDIVKNGLEDFVVFEPFVSKISLQEIYLKFDLVLLLSEYEGFGLPVLEAQSHSKPVVCSNIPVFKEILLKSAFYINLDFDQNEALSLIKKISNKKIMDEMVCKGLENIKRFSWHTMATQTLSLYNSYLPIEG